MTPTAALPTLASPLHYRNFELKLFRSQLDQAHYVEVLSRSDAERMSLSLADLQPLVSRFKNRTAGQEDLETLGGALLQALLPPPIRAIWERSQSSMNQESFLRLRLDIRCPDLAALPWETLYDEDRRSFLATLDKYPIVRYVYKAPFDQPPCPVSDLNILIAVSEPDGYGVPAAKQEVSIIRNALEDLRAQRRVDYQVLEHATLPKLHQHLQRGCNVLHFIGHGVLVEDRGHLILEDEHGKPKWVDAETLSVFYGGTAPLRLLVLNSCETADSSAVDQRLGVAQAALAKVPAVVAMQGKVDDTAAAAFAQGFYAALAEGHPLETCMTEGRKAMIAGNGGLAPADWAVPVLFSNAPDGRLWQSAPPAAAGAHPTQAAPPAAAASAGVRGAPASVPAAAAGPEVLHNLAEGAGLRFVNRSRELQDVLDALDPESGTSVVALTGLRGVGRSALARAAARHFLEVSRRDPQDPRAFRGIVWASAQKAMFTPQSTAPASVLWSLDDLVLAMASALKKQELAQARPEERLDLIADLLHEARYLLVLDDIDELQDARCADFLKTVSSSSPSKVVVTSCSSVEGAGLEIQLGSLEREAALELVREDARAAGLRAVAKAGAAELEELVRQADGLPLALRWAVGQLKDAPRQPVSWVTERLAKAGRQPLAEFCLQSSFERLDRSQRRLLRTFALFPNPTTAEAAAAAAGLKERELGPALQRLVRLRLLSPASRSGQYRMMLLTRQYALADLNLNPPDRSEAVKRAVAFMESFVNEAAPPNQQPDADRLEGEIGNLLWAARQAYDIKEWETVLVFRKSLGDFLKNCGYWNEGIQLGEWAFDAADRLGKNAERGWCALYPLARLYFQQRKYDEAEKWSERALALFEREKDVHGEASARRYLGRILQARGELDKAEDRFRQGLENVRSSTDDRALKLRGHLLASLGGLAEARKQYAEASQKYEQALALYEGRDLEGKATALQSLGRVALRQRSFDEAERRLQESLDFVRGRRWGNREGEVLLTLAQLAEDRGDLSRARSLLTRARERFQAFSAAVDMAHVDAALTRVSAALASSSQAGAP